MLVLNEKGNPKTADGQNELCANTTYEFLQFFCVSPAIFHVYFHSKYLFILFSVAFHPVRINIGRHCVNSHCIEQNPILYSHSISHSAEVLKNSLGSAHFFPFLFSLFFNKYFQQTNIKQEKKRTKLCIIRFC